MMKFEHCNFYRIPVSSIQYLIFEVNRSTSGELVEKAPFLSVGTGVSWTAPGQGCGMGVFHWRWADCTEQQYLCGERMSNQQEETGDKPLWVMGMPDNTCAWSHSSRCLRLAFSCTDHISYAAEITYKLQSVTDFKWQRL